eukprot:scaffold33774_cov72-Cyclotella_meneghiniana.AAC.1
MSPSSPAIRIPAVAPSGDDMLTHEVGRPLVLNLGGNGDRCGGRIATDDTPACSRGVRDGVGRVWGGLVGFGRLFGGCRPRSGWWICRSLG